MASKKDITLRALDVTPTTIIVDALEADPAASQLVIWLYSLDATPSTILLYDPTATPASPPVAGGTKLRTSWGAATMIAQGATFRGANS